MPDDDAADDDAVEHARPEQAEEPVVDIGASNVDLDEARHGHRHRSPSEPEVGHEPDDDGHDDHPVEDPRWVLIPLAIGLIVAVALLVLFGLDSGAASSHTIS